MSARPLQDRVVLITGASGSLGSATALALGAAGATVVLLSRNVPKLEQLYDALLAAGAPKPAIYPLDLAGASEDDYRELAQVIAAEFGTLHGLVHCAAELGALAPIHDISGADWQRRLQVNLTGPFCLTRELLPLLRASKGTVVFTTDSAVGDGKAYWGPYGVAKIALQGFARILAEENASFGIQVEVFAPDPMRSTLRRRAYPAEPADALPEPALAAERILQVLNAGVPASAASQ